MILRPLSLALALSLCSLASPVRPAETAVQVTYLVPAWYFSYGRWRPVLDEVAAGVHVVMHLAEPDASASWFGPDGSRTKRLERILREDPEAIVLRPMETRSFLPRGGRP